MENGHVKRDIEPRDVALGLWALIDGLLRAWMIEPESFSLTGKGDVIVASCLNAIRNGKTG
jgi:TetR/AcrR family acrAB operon transcriptional repressor